MSRLGYHRFAAAGSDWGTSISTSLALYTQRRGGRCPHASGLLSEDGWERCRVRFGRGVGNSDEPPYQPS